MDLLKREMERKKKALALAKEKKKQAGGGNNRYLKASELRRLEEEGDDEGNNDGHKNKKRPLDQGEATVQEDSSVTKKQRKTETKSTETAKKDDNDTESDGPPTSKNSNNKQPLSELEITKRFRELGLPIRMFGETNNRLERLKLAEQQQAATALKHSEQDEFRLGDFGHGIRNPFLEKEDQNDTVAAAAAAQDLKASTPSSKTTATEAGDKKKASEAKKSRDTATGTSASVSTATTTTTTTTTDPHKRVYRHFKNLLKQWEADLNARDNAVKSTVAGRNETKTLKQCKDYIRPLFTQCKNRQLEPNMLQKLVDIVDYCNAGEFVQAHDAYMDVAIGRAAWPIGVTMVGIHARTGRAKIESSNVAHVMNSELQRKYLTSVKRLITYHQSKRPDVDPSKKVVN